MLLAGDVGGTKTLLGLFDGDGRRPRQVVSLSYPTAEFPSFSAILTAFGRDVAPVAGGRLAIDAVAVGVAGPVVNERARVTHIGWDVSVADIRAHFGTQAAAPAVRLLNDLEAMGMCVEVLEAGEVHVLQAGQPDADGNAAIIAAGTGLGAALLHRNSGRLVPVPSEMGHTDFPARTDRELEFVRMIRGGRGRVAVEHMLSGRGLVNLHQFTHGGQPCTAVPDPGDPEAPALVSQAALDATCASCRDALGLFAEAYGAGAGNLALLGVATAGLFVGGGIAPKILPALEDGRFMRAFLDKAPMDALVARIPVRVILNPQAGLLGAAVAAQELISGSNR